MKNCPKCNAQISDTAKFCVKCGCNLKEYEQEQEYFCPECGTKFSGGVFCPECGHNIQKDIAPANETATFESDLDLDALINASEIAVTEKLEQDARQAKLKQLSAFEYEEHTNGTFTITKLKDASALTVIVPEGVDSIAADAFAGSNVMRVTLPETLLQIGDRAFMGCKNLMTISFPASLMIVGDEAFAECSSLDIELPISVKKVGRDIIRNTAPDLRRQEETARLEAELEAKRRAEEETRRKAEEEARQKLLADFEIEDGILIKYKGEGGEVRIPDGVIEIGKRAFESCKNLVEVQIPNSVTSILRDAFEGCTALDEIIIPNSVTKIEGGAFRGCTSLKEIIIPNSVTEMGMCVFDGCIDISIKCEARREPDGWSEWWDNDKYTAPLSGSVTWGYNEKEAYCEALLARLRAGDVTIKI